MRTHGHTVGYKATPVYAAFIKMRERCLSTTQARCRAGINQRG